MDIERAKEAGQQLQCNVREPVGQRVSIQCTSHLLAVHPRHGGGRFDRRDRRSLEGRNVLFVCPLMAEGNTGGDDDGRSIIPDGGIFPPFLQDMRTMRT